MRIKNMKHYILLIVLFVSACTTPQWDAEKNVCMRKGMAQYPPNMTLQTVQKSRFVNVPNGQFTCTSFGSLIECNEGTTLETQYYTVTETYDLNRRSRNNFANSCTRNACWSKYGNADCKVKKK